MVLRMNFSIPCLPCQKKLQASSKKYQKTKTDTVSVIYSVKGSLVAEVPKPGQPRGTQDLL